MTKKLAKRTSEHGQTTKISPSDGRGKIQLPLRMPCWYDFHVFGHHLGNISLRGVPFLVA